MVHTTTVLDRCFKELEEQNRFSGVVLMIRGGAWVPQRDRDDGPALLHGADRA